MSFRQLHFANGLEPSGGEGVPSGDVPGDSRGLASDEGSGAVREGCQDEDVQASSE